MWSPQLDSNRHGRLRRGELNARLSWSHSTVSLRPYGPYGPYGPYATYGPYGPYGSYATYGPYGPYGP